ncbi:hypothetical protein BDV38DRAFT_297010 [Aspergillus pseudotamarii]|uniref:Uncharacterized protein n=1 Tax=Aspergillus pseudotamarii TaxID=132259 RepID=A0A5N6SER5_ASPPS|nr:uncharacterized protein BDV38DRAFT_297010 [Aspergillus pseudotamarii]KAE8132427.1 hypothetical protein BDV38DRAFT_297010 [Aspergillus pseudotamarii]
MRTMVVEPREYRRFIHQLSSARSYKQMKMSICDVQATKLKESPTCSLLPRGEMHVQCYQSAVDPSAQHINCSPDNVMVVGQQDYWQIAKPLVAELCSQWAQDYERAGCTVEALPQRAIYHESNNPLDYLYAIDSHLSDYHLPDQVNSTHVLLSFGSASPCLAPAEYQRSQRRGPQEATPHKERDGAEDILPTSRPESNEKGMIEHSTAGLSKGDGAQSDAFLGCHPEVDFSRMVRDGTTPALGSLPALLDLATDEGETSTGLRTPGTTGSAATCVDSLFVPSDGQDLNLPPAISWRANRILPSATSYTKTIGNCSLGAFPVPSSSNPDRLVEDWRLLNNLDQAIAHTPSPSATTRDIPNTDNYLSPGIESPTCLASTHESPDHRASAQIGLTDTLAKQWADTNRIILYGSILARADIEQILDELQNPQRLSIRTVDFLGDYFSYYCQSSELYIADTVWPDRLHRGILRLMPLPQTILLPSYINGHWSLIEIQIYSGAVIHYSFPAIRPELNEICDSRDPACTPCRGAIEALSQHLRDMDKLCPEWKFYNQSVTTTIGDEGTRLLWTVKQRVNNQSVQEEPSGGFRGSLIREIMADALHVAGKSHLSSPSATSPSRRHHNVISEQAQQRWSAVTITCNTPIDFTHIWERIGHMPLSATVSIGNKQVDRLLRLAFTIASPPVLVELRHQLLYLRQKQIASNWCFQRTPAGVFEAGIWHKGNKHTSRIGLALTCWSVYSHRQQRQQEGYPDPTAQTVVDIYHQLPDAARDYYQVEEKLVRIAGSPNVLCLLPQGVSFAGQDTFSMTDYQTLKKAHFDALETTFQEYRPRITGLSSGQNRRSWQNRWVRRNWTEPSICLWKNVSMK